MTPDHDHRITVTARRWPYVPWLSTTSTWTRHCRCKEADAIISELLAIAEERPDQRLVLTLSCDARPAAETYVSDGKRW